MTFVRNIFTPGPWDWYSRQTWGVKRLRRRLDGISNNLATSLAHADWGISNNLHIWDEEDCQCGIDFVSVESQVLRQSQSKSIRNVYAVILINTDTFGRILKSSNTHRSIKANIERTQSTGMSLISSLLTNAPSVVWDGQTICESFSRSILTTLIIAKLD